MDKYYSIAKVEYVDHFEINAFLKGDVFIMLPEREGFYRRDAVFTEAVPGMRLVPGGVVSEGGRMFQNFEEHHDAPGDFV